jgi:Raf kinase inhibitor-like YbhB/YbcL family protein
VPLHRWLPVAAVVSVSISACDTGDGRTLDPPVFPPPATTLPAEPVVSGVETVPAPMQLIAPWRDGAEIPVRYTCDGEDVSPALSWTNVPADAVELAITVTDLDAPEYVHWLVYGIAPDVAAVGEGAPPAGSSLWANGSGSVEYAGPCPPTGGQHRYRFTLHALNQQLEPGDETTALELIATIELLSTADSSVSGVYTRDD